MDDSCKVPLISLQDISHASNVGGVGIHDLSFRNEAFGGKLIWLMYNKSQSMWCTIMQQKYLDNNDPSRVLSISNPPKGSVVWDFMIGSRKIIVDYISWEVNNGISINFWNDSLNGKIPLSKSGISLNIIHVVKTHWGLQLNQYVDYVSEFSKKIVWKDPSKLPLSRQEINQFQNVLNSSSLYFCDAQDRIFWAPAKDGKYSVKEGYKFL